LALLHGQKKSPAMTKIDQARVVIYRIMFRQPASGKTVSVDALLGKASSGIPHVAVVFKKSHCVALLKSQKKNGLPSHTDMKKVLNQVRDRPSKFLKLAKNAHTNLRESLEALYNGLLVIHNSVQKLSKENAVLLLVDLFNPMEILEERATRLRPKTRHNSKTKEQALLSRVMEVKDQVDEELGRMVNDAGFDKLLRGSLCRRPQSQCGLILSVCHRTPTIALPVLQALQPQPCPGEQGDEDEEQQEYHDLHPEDGNLGQVPVLRARGSWGLRGPHQLFSPNTMANQ
jgi:hypothetical protein